MAYIRILLTFVLVIVFLGCSDSPVQPPDQRQYVDSPAENEEAELIALLLSGELIAPVYYYEKVKWDLRLIRNQRLDSVPEVGIRFEPTMYAGRVYVMFDSTGTEEIINGEYHHWDRFHESIGENPTVRWVFGPGPDVTLHYEGRLHPGRLVDSLAGLPGIRSVGTYGPPISGGESTIWVYSTGGVTKYFFYIMDPYNFLLQTYSYFSVFNGLVSYHGNYVFDYYNPAPEPAWLDTAMMAAEYSHGFYAYWHVEPK